MFKLIFFLSLFEPQPTVAVSYTDERIATQGTMLWKPMLVSWWFKVQ